MEEEIRFSVETLLAVMRHEHRRMSTGATLRQYIHRELSLGNEPNHPRLDWIRSGVYIVMAQLQVLTDQYNKEHLNDKALVGDMLDILASASRTIKNRTGWTGD